MTSYAPGPAPTPLPPPPDGEPIPDRAVVRGRAIGQGALTLVGLGTALLAARAVSIHAPACPFRTVTGIPCPGCGMTRLADTVVHGDLARAMSADAAGVAILVAIVVLAGVHLVQVVIRKADPPLWMRSPLLVGGLVALAAIHWVTTLVTGGLPSS